MARRHFLLPNPSVNTDAPTHVGALSNRSGGAPGTLFREIAPK
jgi:hypothetical protein